MLWIPGREQDRPEHCLAQSCSVTAWNRQGHGLREALQIYSVHIQPSTFYTYILFPQDILCLIVIWLLILNSLYTFFQHLKQTSLLSVLVLMFDTFCPFFTSYEQKGNPALPYSVPRYFKFLNSFPYTTAKAACIWGRMRKGLGQKNPFIESYPFHLCNKYCKWGTAILSSLNTMHGIESGKNKREKMHLTLMSRGKHYHRELSYTLC